MKYCANNNNDPIIIIVIIMSMKAICVAWMCVVAEMAIVIVSYWSNSIV
jgi:hypothetical protein